MSNENYIYTNPGLTIGGTITALPTPDQITVRTVELKAGHVGQVIVGGQVAWETVPFIDVSDAAKAARDHVQTKLALLFA